MFRLAIALALLASPAFAQKTDRDYSRALDAPMQPMRQQPRQATIGCTFAPNADIPSFWRRPMQPGMYGAHPALPQSMRQPCAGYRLYCDAYRYSGRLHGCVWARHDDPRMSAFRRAEGR